jgi:hypothetical protein
MPVFKMLEVYILQKQFRRMPKRKMSYFKRRKLSGRKKYARKRKGDEQYSIKKVSTFGSRRKKMIEMDERTKFAFRKKVIVNFAFRRRGDWYRKRRRIMMYFLVIFIMETRDVETGENIEVIIQRSFTVSLVNTSYLWASRVAEKVIEKVDREARRLFGTKNVLGTYLSQVDVGEATKDKLSLDEAVLRENSERKKLKMIT